MKKIYLFFAALLCTGALRSQTVSTFENLSLAADTFWVGDDLSGGFTSGNAYFINNYDTTYSTWSGFAYTNKKDTLTGGFANPYSAATGGGYNGSANYALANMYGDARIKVTGTGANKLIEGFYITNNMYAYTSMRDGDMFAKKFGGVSGNDEDWFKLTVKGYTNGVFKTNQVEFYLADYRFGNNAQDYIVTNWQWVDLSPLGEVDSIQFFLTSSDTGLYGMNTPAYFCMDDFTTANVLNEAPVGYDEWVTLTYLTDTLIQVTANDFDTTAAPLSARVIAGPVIPGAIAYDSAYGIFYRPAVGIVSVDTITYALCDAAGLCDTARLFITVTPTGINEIAALQLRVQPNPFQSALTVYHSTDVDRVTLYDMQGRQLVDIRCNYTQQTQIDGSSLPQGMYMARLTAGNKTAITKVVKQ